MKCVENSAITMQYRLIHKILSPPFSPLCADNIKNKNRRLIDTWTIIHHQIFVYHALLITKMFLTPNFIQKNTYEFRVKKKTVEILMKNHWLPVVHDLYCFIWTMKIHSDLLEPIQTNIPNQSCMHSTMKKIEQTLRYSIQSTFYFYEIVNDAHSHNEKKIVSLFNPYW